MKIQIKECGDYLNLNSNGEIIPLASSDKINEKWQPFIADYIDFFKKHLGESLVSVHVRGSVAKGSDEEGVADFDGMVFTNKEIKLNGADLDELESNLLKKYPFCNGIEIAIIAVDDIDFDNITKAGNIWPKFLKTQSACLYGEDLTKRIKPFLLNDMYHYSKYIKCSLEDKWVNYIEEDKDDAEELKSTCDWGCRLLLRSGFELVMGREGKWTNDLYRCFESLSKYYPEKKDLFSRTLYLVLNPVADAEEILKVKESWTPWLYDELKVQCDIDGDLKY